MRRVLVLLALSALCTGLQCLELHYSAERELLLLSVSGFANNAQPRVYLHGAKEKRFSKNLETGAYEVELTLSECMHGVKPLLTDEESGYSMWRIAFDAAVRRTCWLELHASTGGATRAVAHCVADCLSAFSRVSDSSGLLLHTESQCGALYPDWRTPVRETQRHGAAPAPVFQDWRVDLPLGDLQFVMYAPNGLAAVISAVAPVSNPVAADESVVRSSGEPWVGKGVEEEHHGHHEDGRMPAWWYIVLGVGVALIVALCAATVVLSLSKKGKTV